MLSKLIFKDQSLVENFYKNFKVQIPFLNLNSSKKK